MNNNLIKNQVKTGNKTSAYLKSGQTYHLTAGFNASDLYGIYSININTEGLTLDNSKEITLDNTNQRLFEFNSTSNETYKISSEDISIGITVLNDRMFYLNSSEKGRLFQEFIAGEKYYILFTKETTSDLYTTVKIEEIEKLEKDTEFEKEFDNEYYYYKFKSDSEGNYTVAIKGYGNYSLFTDITASGGLLESVPFGKVTVGCTIVNIYLGQNQSFNLGIKFNSGFEIPCIVKFSKAEDTYKWVIQKSAGEEELNTAEEFDISGVLIMKRGTEAIVRLKVGDYYFDGFIYNLSLYSGKFSYDGNTLIIESDRQLFNNDKDNPIILVVARELDIIPLYVLVTYDKEPEFTAYRNSNSDYGFKWEGDLCHKNDKGVVISGELLNSNNIWLADFITGFLKSELKFSINDFVNKSIYKDIDDITIVIKKFVLYNANGTPTDIYINAIENKIHKINIINELFVNPYYNNGKGSNSDPFIIKTAEELKNIGKTPNYGSGLYFKIDTRYITCENWIPIEDFRGILHGNNNEIFLSMDISASSSGLYGLFARNNGTIENLKMTSSGITVSGDFGGQIYIGLFAGINYGTIDNCTTTGGKSYNGSNMLVCKRDASDIGGIAGQNQGIIRICTNIYILAVPEIWAE